jgi:hypothetical protein
LLAHRLQTLLSKKPPVESGPTCSRGAVCELRSAPNENSTITNAMRLRMELAEGFMDFYIVSLGNLGGNYNGVKSGLSYDFLKRSSWNCLRRLSGFCIASRH